MIRVNVKKGTLNSKSKGCKLNINCTSSTVETKNDFFLAVEEFCVTQKRFNVIQSPADSFFIYTSR